MLGIGRWIAVFTVGGVEVFALMRLASLDTWILDEALVAFWP